jgi:predicted outer membrane protein
MNMTDIAAISGVTAQTLVAPVPRSVDAAVTQQFRASMAAPDCANQAGAACKSPTAASPQLAETLNMDIEKVLAAHMPSANASPAEFAVGMLRAQVKVSQAAIAIEMVSKTTQSLSQGVQSLTTKS